MAGEASRRLTGYRKIPPARFNELIMLYKNRISFLILIPALTPAIPESLVLVIRGFDKCRNIAVQRLQRFLVRVDHVSGRVVTVLDILLQAGGDL